MLICRLALFAAAALVSGCAAPSFDQAPPALFTAGESLARQSRIYQPLEALPERSRPVRIAVYDIPDLTGAHAKNTKFAEYSKAVTQGADAFVVDALRDTGGGTWFKVLERRFSDALLNERRLAIAQVNEQRQREHVSAERARIAGEIAAAEQRLAAMRKQIEADYTPFEKAGMVLPGGMPPKEQTLANFHRYRKDQLGAIKPEVPFTNFAYAPPVHHLQTADFLITGAVVAYDADIASGGVGLRISNVGLSKEMRKDSITITLRLVDAQSGEILDSSTIAQTVISKRKQGDFLNYVTLNTVLEFEAGYVINEPAAFAMDAAIRLGLSQILQNKAVLAALKA
ncbi:hypothetical protein RA19_05305 [Leisingera sp. ANG-M1]|uniref:CsgG/HfaB family protein n=1 Tax=Leisingera sp. ANG-M1 TaxID=1577895 RepID=UPI00057F2E24|nr:CsgG/HfaB family protein [Leisingera sp. ANG-M1]KIC12029.1 hypothetical protein RA19_05305 [Leisingera sp. ANG-M1]